MPFRAPRTCRALQPNAHPARSCAPCQRLQCQLHAADAAVRSRRERGARAGVRAGAYFAGGAHLSEDFTALRCASGRHGVEDIVLLDDSDGDEARAGARSPPRKRARRGLVSAASNNGGSGGGAAADDGVVNLCDDSDADAGRDTAPTLAAADGGVVDLCGDSGDEGGDDAEDPRAHAAPLPAPLATCAARHRGSWCKTMRIYLCRPFRQQRRPSSCTPRARPVPHTCAVTSRPATPPAVRGGFAPGARASCRKSCTTR